MRWSDFAVEAPELAALGEQRFRQRQLCLLATLRRSGHPRVSPVEPDFVDGELMLGMMWRSRKAQDLLRDPTCSVHSVVTDREGTDGDFKLYGRAADVPDAERRRRFRAVIHERIGWAPEEPNFHLFAIDIDAAAFVIFGEERYGLAWSPGVPVRRWTIDA